MVGANLYNILCLISLNLNSSFLDRAASAASLLHSLGELLLLRQTDANEPRHDRHRLAPAMRRLPQDVHPASVLTRCGNCRRRLAARLAGLIFWRWRQPRAAQPGERIVPKAPAAIDGNAFLATHFDILYSKRCRMQIQATVTVRWRWPYRRGPNFPPSFDGRNPVSPLNPLCKLRSRPGSRSSCSCNTSSGVPGT